MNKTTPLQRLEHPLFNAHRVQVWIKRDDLNHPLIQGNKWHKLRLNIQQAKREQKTSLLSFGGAFSNHILALAAAANDQGLNSIGYIRGDELADNHQAWSSTLKHAQGLGMQLKFIDRQTYRMRDHQAWLSNLQAQYPDAYILPEGGSNRLALNGIAELAQHLMQQQADFDYLLCAVGSGGTLAGLAKHLPNDKQILGIACLKQADYLITKIQDWLVESKENWQLLTQFHGGGFGKTNSDIVFKSNEFEQEFKVLLDPVYTAKMIYAFYQLLEQNYFAPDSKIILYHSGGLQGRADS